MYVVVEFGGEEANKTAVVRREWLTPKKKEVFWPPYKLSSQFAKALNDGTCPNEDNWTLYPVVRCLYFSDDLLKARQKEREAEKDSDLQTECEEGLNVRKRKKRPIRLSSSEEDEEFRFPTPPKRLKYSGCTTKSPETIPSRSYPSLESPRKINNLSSLNSPGSSGSTPAHRPTSIQQGEIITNSGFTIVAGRLAKLELEIASIKEYLEDFLPKLLKGSKPIGNEVVRDSLPPLPCKNGEEVFNLEEWLSSSENQDLLVQYLSRIGGRTVEYVVKKVLERVFSNNVAQLFNWTGKHNKLPLKELKILDIIYRVVRNNSETTTATECEIVQKSRSWFRFAKDREGGREERRKKNVNAREQE